MKRVRKMVRISENLFVMEPSEDQKVMAGIFMEDKSVELKDCSICYTETSNVVILNCGHGGLCSICMSSMLQKKRECPLCRATIEECLEYSSDSKGLHEYVRSFGK